MALEDVQPGQRLERSLSAKTWNLHNAAARSFLAGGIRPGRMHRAAGGVAPRDGNVIKVRNNSAADQPQFAVLGIDSLLHTPESDVNSEVMLQFRAQPYLDCVAPAQADHWGGFVVLLDGLADGAIGRAAVCGATVCKIDMKHESHVFADVKDADATQLRSAGCGSARILAVESGTGAGKWGIVSLQSRGVYRFPILLTENAQTNAGKWKYAWSEVVVRNDGTAETVTGGLSGTTSTGYALNRREINHTGTGIVQGVDIAHDDYPDGYAPRPVDGGGTDNTHQQDIVVDAELIDGRVWFSEPLSHDGACAAPE